MLNVKVMGFRGAERVGLQIESTVLIAGANEAGKSSVCQALAAAATGCAVPFFTDNKPDKPRFTKAAAKGLLRAGMDKGSASISNGTGDPLATVAWPAFECASNGFHVSPVAAGLVHPLGFDETERQRYFAQLLKADPDSDDLALALGDARVDVAMGREVMERVNTQGFDNANRLYREEGTRLKGQWEAITGQNFGAKKIVNWRPEGWEGTLGAMTIEQADALCVKAQADLDKAIGALAVDAAQVAEIEDKAKREPGIKMAMEAAKAKTEETVRVQTACITELKNHTVPAAMACPHCGGLVDVVDGKLAESSAGPEQIKREKKVHAELERELESAKLDVRAAADLLLTAHAAFSLVAKAGEHLAAAKARTGTDEAVNHAQDVLRTLTADKGKIEAVQKAQAVTERILALVAVVDILAPEGLRRRKLQGALTRFNQKFLAPLCAEASYPPILLTDDLDVTYGGRAYYLLADSAAYRCRAVVQMAVALIEKAPMVIMDKADILDREGRNGLLSMLSACPDVYAIVGMTIDPAREGEPWGDVPDLAAAGLGRTYWMEGGISRAIGG